MKKHLAFLNLLTVLLLFSIVGCGTYENPAIQIMIEAWPQISPATIRLLITLPSLTSMFAMVLVGQYVGRYIRYRTCLIVGSLLALVAGVLPFFLHQNWYLILVFRFFLGIGVGLLSVRQSLLVLTVPPQELAKMVGYGSVIGSLTSATISPLVGKLASYGWHYAFLSNLILVVIALFILLFCQEPQMSAKKAPTAQASKEKMPAMIYLFLFVQFLATLVLYPLLSGISSYLSELKIGSSTTAGLLLSIYTAAGIFSNLFLARLQKRFKAQLLSVFLFLPVIGLSLVIFTRQIFLIGLGVFLSGMGFITFSSTLQVYAGLICPQQKIAKASTLLLAATQFGVFLSSYFIEWTTALGWFEVTMKNPYFVCLAIYLVFALGSWQLRHKTYPAILLS